MLKDISDDLRAQLEQEAAANFRTLDQEALASGPATPLTQAEMDQVRDRVLGRNKAS